MCVGPDEFKSWMKRPGAVDHFGRKVHPHAPCRLQYGKQIAQATTDLEHMLTGVYKETVNFLDAPVIPSSEAPPCGAFVRHSVPVGDSGSLILISGGIEGGDDFHGGLIVRGEAQIAQVSP